jgi:hypothetical protein
MDRTGGKFEREEKYIMEFSGKTWGRDVSEELDVNWRTLLKWVFKVSDGDEERNDPIMGRDRWPAAVKAMVREIYWGDHKRIGFQERLCCMEVSFKEIIK